MFEVLRNNERAGHLPDAKYLLFHDGEPIEKILVEAENYGHKHFYKIETLHKYESKYILGCSFQDFIHFASKIILRDVDFIEGFNWKIEIRLELSTSEIHFNLTPNLELWNYPYSFSSYRESFLKVFNELSSYTFYSSYNFNLANSSSLSLIADHDFKNKSFSDELGCVDIRR